MDLYERLEVKRFNKLLRQAKYNEKAFDELYSFYYSRIIKHLQVRYGRPLSEDVAQEFFINLITQDKDYNYVNSPTSWVYACCENIAKRKIVYDSRYSLCGDDIDGGIKSVNLLKQIDSSDEVERLLSIFDDETKQIIYLVYWEGYNLKEVSEILGKSYTAVRKRYSRAMKKMKKLSHSEG